MTGVYRRLFPSNDLRSAVDKNRREKSFFSFSAVPAMWARADLYVVVIDNNRRQNLLYVAILAMTTFLARDQ